MKVEFIQCNVTHPWQVKLNIFCFIFLLFSSLLWAARSGWFDLILNLTSLL